MNIICDHCGVRVKTKKTVCCDYYSDGVPCIAWCMDCVIENRRFLITNYYLDGEWSNERLKGYDNALAWSPNAEPLKSFPKTKKRYRIRRLKCLANV